METSYIKNIPFIPDPGVPEISLNDLRQARNRIIAPFQLTLTDSENNFICEEIVRNIPGRRIVGFGTWEEKNVVGKLFYDWKKAKNHLEREINGIETLIQAGIPTPKILWHGSAKKNKIQVLLLERILNGSSLDKIWHEEKETSAAEEIMHAMTIELATQHVLGVLQQDLHLKNFIVTPQLIYTLDGAGIIRYNDVLTKEASLDHLGLFFSQLGVGTERLQNSLFQTYVKARSWIVNKSDMDFLRKSTNKWQKKRWVSFDKKIWRNCTSFATRRHLKSKIIFVRNYISPQFDQLLREPDACFKHKNSDILKNDYSTSVAKIKINNQYLVIKRYNVKNFMQWLRFCMRPSRAAHAWKYAQRLWLLEVSSPKPIAVIENRFLGLRGTSYFINEFIEGQPVDAYFLKQSEENTSTFEKVATDTVAIFVNLSKLNLTSSNLKPSHILIKDKNKKPVLANLDNIVEHSTYFSLRKALRVEIKRLMHFWENHLDIRTVFEKVLDKFNLSKFK